ncbi:MAG: hypothetical protein P1U69_11285 [Parvibaculaceae bacterium]|nr:hypothetical protein [Parvibaculaceae bacterium]HBM89842.1 hypothetical protein [Rhodobiaceae bacterium]|tara:strand:+ start:153 stop:623 length:471 start_codon:yes stop_codon:yes gene_type:complete
MIAFCAHPTGNITLPTAANYNQVILPDVAPGGSDPHNGYNLGSRYDTSTGTWSPVQGEEPAALVSFAGQVWIPNAGPLGSGQNFVARIVKNGYPGGITVGAAIASKGPFANDWVITLSMQDLATAGDEYGLYVFTQIAPAIIDGHPLHTFWNGKVG